MKTTIIHLKKWGSNLRSKIKQHEFCVYGFFFVLTLLFSFYFLGKIENTSELIKRDKEIIYLNTQIQEYHQMFHEQQEAIEENSQDMHEAQEVIRGQSRFIQDIILYLKRIGHWPPKISPQELRDSNSSEA